MNQRERNDLDRYITGNGGEDQFEDDCPECCKPESECICGRRDADDYDEFEAWEKEHAEPEPEETFTEADE